MKIISFIVPAFNSEKFLEKCVASLIGGEASHKLEVIIVNDGSTDKTEEIAAKLCNEYPDTVRLINQENRGHGGALNTGCAAAEGKYLKVIDADDTVETANLAEFICLLEKSESDVVLTHYRTCDISTGKTEELRCYTKEFGKELSIEDITADFKSFDKTFTFHGITYNTNFYRENSAPLAEKVFYEDHEYSTFPACLAKTVTPLDIFVYRYRIGDVSQSVSAENQLKRISHTEYVLSHMTAQYDLIKDRLSDLAADFVVLKIRILLLSYLVTVLLVEKNKKSGRIRAAETVSKLQNTLPKAACSVSKKYKLLKALNRLHISKKTFDKVISSKAYKLLTGDKR